MLEKATPASSSCAPAPPPAKNWWLRIGATFVCLLLVGCLVDPEQTWYSIARADGWYLTLSALCYLGGALAGGLAWRICFKALGDRLPLFTCMRLTLVGFVLNNLIPGGIAGDVYRVYGAVQTKISLAHAIAAVVLERWSSLLALLVVTACSDLLELEALSKAFLTIPGWETWLASYLPPLLLRLDVLMGIILLSLLVFFALTSSMLMQAAASRKPQEPSNQLQQEVWQWGVQWQEFVQALGLMRQRRLAFCQACALDMLSPLLEGLSFSLAAIAVGVKLPAFLFLAFTPIFRLVQHLPISINAVGTQELVSIMLWHPLGANSENAVAISMLIHLIKLALCLIGLPWLLHKTTKS